MVRETHMPYVRIARILLLKTDTYFKKEISRYTFEILLHLNISIEVLFFIDLLN